MNRTIYALLLLSSAFSLAASELDAILDQHAQAVGKSQLWAEIENLRLELDIREPTFEVSAVYSATRQGSMRIDVFAQDQHVFAEGLHDNQAWEWRPDTGHVLVDGTAAAALRHGIEKPGRFFTLGQLREQGITLELVEVSSTASPDEWQIRATLNDGFVVDYFMDRKSHLLTRSRDFRAFHPTMDPEETVIETRYLESQWVDGVLRNTVSENIDAVTGNWLGSTTVRDIQHNVSIQATHFMGADLH